MRIHPEPAVPSPFLAAGQSPMMTLPAGDALSEGAPQASYPPGRYRARSPILVAWLQPALSASTFSQRFAANLRDLVPGATANSGSITVGAPTTINAVIPLSAAQRIATSLGASLVPGGLIIAIAAAALRSTVPYPVPCRWFNVEMDFTAMQQWNTDDLNRAIARSFAQATSSWSSLSNNQRSGAGNAPPDGGPLHARFRAPGACTGAADYGEVYARACTRVLQTSVGAATMTPIAPPPHATSEAVRNDARCTLRTTRPILIASTAAGAWGTSGTRIPAGTQIAITSWSTVEDRGGQRVYKLRVTNGGAQGYAALGDNDVRTCSTEVPRPSAIATRPSGPRTPSHPTEVNVQPIDDAAAQGFWTPFKIAAAVLLTVGAAGTAIIIATHDAAAEPDDEADEAALQDQLAGG